MKSRSLGWFLGLILFFVSLLAIGATNEPSHLAVTNSAVQTTVEQVLASILQGAKTETASVYTQGKQVLSATLVAVSTEAPLVVNEFLRWSAVKAVALIALAAGILALIYFCVLYVLNNGEQNLRNRLTQYKEKSSYTSVDTIADLDGRIREHQLSKKVARYIALLLLVIWTSSPFGDLLMLATAPKVFLVKAIAEQVRK